MGRQKHDRHNVKRQHVGERTARGVSPAVCERLALALVRRGLASEAILSMNWRAVLRGES